LDGPSSIAVEDLREVLEMRAFATKVLKALQEVNHPFLR